MGNFKSKIILILICLFSLKSYGFIGICDLFETSTEAPQNIEDIFDVNRKLPGQELTPLQTKVVFHVIMDSEEKANLSIAAFGGHLKFLYQKYNLSNRNALAAFAVHKSFINPTLALKTKGYSVSYFGGEYDLSPRLAEEIAGLQGPFREYNRLNELTPTERVVLLYGILGYTTKGTSREMSRGERTVGEHTVNDYRQSIFKKLRYNSLAKIAAYTVWLKFFDLTDDLFFEQHLPLERARKIARFYDNK